ncbi:hypothetical protein DFH11DRAFT_1517039 [Phellopilus nigrolimitatus]|nr:hypothetical protein DFH11DRAFT_1517039 [Phellopilus nigrolimitatus]
MSRPPPAEYEQVVSKDAGTGDRSSPAQVEDTGRIQIERPLSVTSGQTSWYSPWGWYEWYNAPTAPETPEEVSVSKTDAELVREEALARSDPLASIAKPLPASGSDASLPAPEIPPEPVNPIISSVAENSKGWTSFFSSSRSLTIKSVTEKAEKSDRGMEVMNIDDDGGDGGDAAVAPSLPSASPQPQTQTSPMPIFDTAGGDGKPRENATQSLKDEGAGFIKPKSAAGAPLTSSENVKRKVITSTPNTRPASPTPSVKSIVSPNPRPINLVLPTFADTFGKLPRSRAPPRPKSAPRMTIKKTLGFVNSVLFAREPEAPSKGKERAQQAELADFGKELPRAWEVLGEVSETRVLAACKKVVVIGIHGWFPGYAMRTVLGEPTGTSAKFANMMQLAVENFAEKRGIKFEEITKIPLEGEGKIEHRVQKLYRNLSSNDSWMEALRDADVIFVATHSQGCIVSTHLINRLIADGHIRTTQGSADALSTVAANIASGSGGAIGAFPADKHRQYVCCLALCGIHLGPLAYLHKNSFLMPYIQYFESEAAAELFEFQNPESQVSKEYVEAVRHVLNHEVKLVYVASMNDQVVPVYSGAFSSASHPLILRALYIDGDAYHSSDFLSNLLVLLLRIRNAGLSDGGLLAHLSEATAGSLSGVGHSTAYEELSTFSLAVDYLFLVNDGYGGPHELAFEPFNARNALNDYEIPWALRDLIADERVMYLFSREFADLRDAFDDWQPRTTILRDLKRKLEPIRRLKLTSRL